MRLPASLRHGLAAFVVCALLSAMAVNRFVPEGLNADTMLQSLMSLQHTTLFFWGQNRLVNLIPFLLSWIATPQLNMWAHLWTFAFSFFALLAVLAFSGSKRLSPDITWPDRWLVFLVLTAVSVLVLGPQAAAVLLAEGQPYAPSFLLLAIAALILTRNRASALAISFALLCLFAAIGLNPSVVILAASLGVLVMTGLAVRKAAVIIVAAVVFFGVWLALSQLAPAPSHSYFSIDLRTPVADLSDSADAIFTALRPAGLVVVGCALAVGGFAGLGHPRSPRERCAGLYLGALAVGWWIVFSINEWVKVANQSHFRFFSVTILALIVVAALLLFSFARHAGRRSKALYGVVCAATIVGCLWRPPVPWAKYEVIEAVAEYVDFAERVEVKFVVGEYWRAWPTVFEVLNRGKPSFGFAWRGEGNRAAIVAAIRDDLRRGRVSLALCIGEPAKDCIENAVKVSGFKWVEASRTCPVGSCLLIQVVAPAP